MQFVFVKAETGKYAKVLPCCCDLALNAVEGAITFNFLSL